MTRRVVMLSTILPLLLLGVALLAGDQMAYAQQPAAIQRKVLLQQDVPIPGHQMVMTLVEIPPGVREIRHTHPGVLGGYVLEGTLTLEHEGRSTATYKAGESFFVEAGKRSTRASMQARQGAQLGERPGPLVVDQARHLQAPL